MLSINFEDLNENNIINFLESNYFIELDDPSQNSKRKSNFGNIEYNLLISNYRVKIAIENLNYFPILYVAVTNEIYVQVPSYKNYDIWENFYKQSKIEFNFWSKVNKNQLVELIKFTYKISKLTTFL